MIVGLEQLLIILGISVPVYWLIPQAYFAVRQAVLLVVSVLLLFSISPLIFIWLCLFLAVLGSIVLAARFKASIRTLRIMSWGCFAPLPLIELVDGRSLVLWLGWQQHSISPEVTALHSLGASYCAIRSFLIVREALRRGEFRILESLTALVFFPSFVAGPIAGSAPFTREAVARELEAEAALVAASRIGAGLALFLVLKPLVADADLRKLFGAADGSGVTALTWLSMYRSFLALYLDFTGYSEIAIGTALLFGIKLPENFRMPLLSRSMQDFWQRWHLSLGQFIGTYLFKPLVRARGNPRQAILVAFVLVGLWHNMTWTYLLWGIGHGLVLAVNMQIAKKASPGYSPGWLRSLRVFGGWFATITLVSYLSVVANSRSLAEAGRFTAALIGF